METNRFFTSAACLLLLTCMISCKGQDKKSLKFSPDVKITVNKEFDRDNNVIRYDSSYSYSYNSNGSFPPDSVFSKLNWPNLHKFEATPFGFNRMLRVDSLFNLFNPDNFYERLLREEELYNDFILQNHRYGNSGKKQGKKSNKQY